MGLEGVPEAAGKIGEPWRNRTSNLLIKSPLQDPPDHTSDDPSIQDFDISSWS